MKATELIQRLQELIDEHGDLDVEYMDHLDGECSFRAGNVYKGCYQAFDKSWHNQFIIE